MLNRDQQELEAELARLAEMEGLTVTNVSWGHYHISGKGILVNYYPFSKRRTAYVGGTRQELVECTQWDAVQLALKAPDPKSVLKKHPVPTTSKADGVYVAPPAPIQQPTTGVAPWE